MNTNSARAVGVAVGILVGLVIAVLLVRFSNKTINIKRIMMSARSKSAEMRTATLFTPWL